MDAESTSSFKSEGSPDLGLDPSDPLNLLLNSNASSQDGSDGSQPAQSPPDWSQVSSMWPYLDNNDKNMPVMSDFSMDLDSQYNNMFGDKPPFNDPSSYSINDLLANNNQQQFPFTFQATGNASLPPNSHSGAESHRRLSIASSSSSSGGASFSSLSDSSHATNDAAAELAQRVRESAGVMLAVQVGSQGPAYSPEQQPPQQQPHILTQLPQDLLQGMPIPQIYPGGFLMPNPNVAYSTTSNSSPSSAASTPPPLTPPFPTPGGTMGMIARPKTSHTTIERRYRTNLNARIQSLRMAVPALRVLENREGRKVKANMPYGKVRTIIANDEEIIDEVDDRGFVDGVKVARKCSKANVLGKAVEYIRVLKKREGRLKREQSGLKSLVEGLVGGPALLREWEREWKNKFGGEEKDEVEDEQVDEGSDDSGDEDDDDEGPKKKKVKKQAPPPKPKERKPPAPPQPTIPGVVPEKRKRGRPRKVVPPPVVAAPANMMPSMFVAPIVPLQQQQQMPPIEVPIQQEQTAEAQSQGDGKQYLLAVFALFSFFNTPLPTSSPFGGSEHPHEWDLHKMNHTGYVIAPHPPLLPPRPPPSPAWGWSEWIQSFHLIVSIVVFATILLPWIPVKAILRPLKFRSRPPRSSTVSRNAARPETVLVSALQFQKRGTPTEAADIKHALGACSAGVMETIKRVLTGKVTATTNFERKGLEQRAWVRLGEIAVHDEVNTSYWSRIQTFWHMRAMLSWFTCSVGDLSTLALVVHPISKSRAQSIWSAARARQGVLAGKPHERLVLESLNIDEAIRRLQEPGCDKRLGPIAALAHKLVRERIKKHLEGEFVRMIQEPSSRLDDSPSSSSSLVGQNEERRLIDSARSLGGRISELGEVLDRGFDLSGVTSLSSTGSEGIDAEISALLSAVSLYRQVFPSSLAGSSTAGVSILLSPAPSSPLGKHQTLRRALGSPVFEGDEELEDARDRVVDMLCEAR